MPTFEFTHRIGLLDKNRGGYCYLQVDAEVINKYENKRHVRLVIEIDEKISWSCGLNHLGDGNFFIIVAKKHLKPLGKKAGDEVYFKIYEDPNPLGVEVPEVLQVLLDQDPEALAIYEGVSDGLKRSLIHYIKPVKDVDLQVKRILETLEKFRQMLAKKAKKTSS